MNKIMCHVNYSHLTLNGIRYLFNVFVFPAVVFSRTDHKCHKIIPENVLSYDVAVIQWITSCHKNRMTTRVITLWREYVTSLTTSVSTVRFLLEILSILKAIKSHFKGSYDKGILHSVVIL